MSVILFFGFSFFVVAVGFIYLGFAIRHHYLEYKRDSEAKLK
jgi:hypothetical protein